MISKVKGKGFRTSLGLTKLQLIIGYHSGHNYNICRKHGLTPFVYKNGWQKDYIQTSGYSLWIKQFCILFSHYQHASKFGLTS